MRRPKILGEEFVDQIFGIVLGHANFFEDDGFFAVDFVFGKFRIENHVRQDVEGFGQMFIENARIEADHFLGGEGVKHAADAINFARDIFSGAARGAFENHVLDEMRNAVHAGRFAARAGAQPYAHGNGVDVLHRLGDDDEPVRKGCCLDLVICVGHCPCLIPLWHGEAINVMARDDCFIADCDQVAAPESARWRGARLLDSRQL